ncbi:1420_t:CDS:2 [Cetraspora pellucida]|uniref:1420_t:CDS:1 n=1 Tax=Cetraspora pellucida TaxID=1433469 RepID=A0A9N8WNP5_9GLOM|nr:1420_t:CDS:2 [Cetraspora pellucida]
MDPYKDYFLDPGFLPQKVTMARLREILGEHNVHYTGNEKKAELVELFNKQIKPLIPSLREKEQELENYRIKTEAELTKSAERKAKTSRKSVASSPETPQTTPKPSRSSKRNSKGKVKAVVNETELLSEESTDVDSRTIKVRSIAPDLVPDLTPRINDKGRLYPELSNSKSIREDNSINRRVIKEDNSTNRREAVAYAFRNPNYMPTRQINRQPSPELIKSQTKPRGLKTTLTLFFIILIIGTYAKIKMELGFCDGSPNAAGGGNTESETPFFEITCTPCPDHAHCSEGKITSCDEGYIVTSSSIHWLKPFTSRCTADLVREYKIEKYTELLKKISAEETGKVECGNGDRERLLFQNLTILLRKKKLPSQDTDDNFEKFAQAALKNLRTDPYVDDVEIIDERESFNKLKSSVISKKPKHNFLCKIKLFGTILAFVALGGIGYKVREKIWENEQVNKAADTVLNTMRQERSMISIEWRERVMPQIKNDFKRIELWKRVEKCVQKNPMVRTRRLQHEGLHTYTWEWLVLFMDNSDGQKDNLGNVAEEKVVSCKNELENIKEVVKGTEGKNSTTSNTYSLIETTSMQKEIMGDTSQSSTTEFPAKVGGEPGSLELQRQDTVSFSPKNSSIDPLMSISDSTSDPYKPINMFFKHENHIASDLQLSYHLDSNPEINPLSVISEEGMMTEKDFSGPSGKPIPLNILSSSINPSDIVTPKQIVRIERDYTRGEMCQFQSAFPLEIDGRVTPRQFQQTINRLNELLVNALNPKYNWFDNCLACVTIYVSTLCMRSHYEKVS